VVEQILIETTLSIYLPFEEREAQHRLSTEDCAECGNVKNIICSQSSILDMAEYYVRAGERVYFPDPAKRAGPTRKPRLSGFFTQNPDRDRPVEYSEE
jgi:hypothetical protein